MLLCNAVIYHSMWTISVNHLLSLACVRSLNSGKKKSIWNESEGLNIVHSDWGACVRQSSLCFVCEVVKALKKYDLQSVCVYVCLKLFSPGRDSVYTCACRCVSFGLTLRNTQLSVFPCCVCFSSDTRVGEVNICMADFQPPAP